ncbi:DoxX family protein [Archangium violaceum]|uniref:DoxX family protein n=1 Tax=Archangium violaceum TaxID=83451 RepID=UPI001EF0C4E4|nr:DoxX family membrane protein [Archangium violaceum]
MNDVASKESVSTTSRAALSDAALGHLVLRLVLGINIAMHGLTRVGDPAGFAQGIVNGFAQTPLPVWSVRLFGLVLPFLELVTGVGMLLGWRLRAFLLLGGVTIAALTFGTCLRQQWETAGLQLFYALAYAWLLHHAAEARFTVDSWLARRR